jgi:hypothetical protein
MKRKNPKDFDENGQKGDWCFHAKDTNIWIQFGDDRFRDSVSLPISVDGSIPIHGLGMVTKIVQH